MMRTLTIDAENEASAPADEVAGAAVAGLLDGQRPWASEAAPMVARDLAMLAVVRQVEHVAPSNATVLITGATGTGKEMIAAHLHRSSGRRERPFVAVNCVAIPDNLLESELFGYEKGAFSGAWARHVGKFEAASGGTLLLDEIGEMDLRMQAKVLRALQERQIDRVGGDQPIPIDVRIIATTNRNLEEEVRLGRFRADLFFRLNVITVKLPPLRERPADIPALAEMFIRSFSWANGVEPATLAPCALAALQRHPWPGNVRELQNVMHRAVLTQCGPWITAPELNLDPVEAADAEPPAVEAREAGFSVSTTGRTIEAVEKDMILDTLRQCKGNRNQTASVLGISIRTLRNKLQEYERSGTRIPRPIIVAVG